MTTTLTVGAIENNAIVVANTPFSAATLADWINFCDVQPATQRTYDKAIKSFFGYLKANNIAQPSREDIIGYRESLLAGNYKVSSVRLYMTICKKFFRWLSSKGLFLNVADGVKMPAMPTDEHARDALTLEEAKQAIFSFKGTTEKQLRDKCILGLMIGCGLRSVEVVRLDVGDMEKRRGQWFIRVWGKRRAGKVDTVKISAELKKLVDEYLSVRPAGKKGTPLFVSTANRNRGQRLQTQSISRLAKKVFKGIGIESDRVTCHSCRNTFCTLALLGGTPIRECARAMRHRSITVTERYACDLDAFNNTAVATVTSALFAA